MRVIPVLDVKGGLAVHAVEGRRSEYRPVVSVLYKSPDPIGLAGSFRQLGLDELYIADLDSIERVGDNLWIISEVKHRFKTRLLVDAGIDAPNVAIRLVDMGVDEVVVGTETLQALAKLRGVVEAIGSDHVVASLDLMMERVVARDPELTSLSPLEAAEALMSQGVGGLIVIELDRVGSLRGPNLELLSRIRERVGLPLLVGGGVRGLNDLLALQDVGVDGALVATALHKGSLRAEDLAWLRERAAPRRWATNFR